jgi:hypothetical protein
MVGKSTMANVITGIRMPGRRTPLQKPQAMSFPVSRESISLLHRDPLVAGKRDKPATGKAIAQGKIPWLKGVFSRKPDRFHALTAVEIDGTGPFPSPRSTCFPVAE